MFRKIDCIPVYAFICGESHIALAYYDKQDILIIESFDFYKMNKVTTNLKFMNTHRKFSSFYFTITKISMLLLKYECGSIICYFLNGNLEIKS